MLVVPQPASARWHPDVMELEGLARALGVQDGFQARFSDQSGRERSATAWRDLRPASGVVLVDTKLTRVVTSEALFAFAEASCRCGGDALVDIHELYKRTHGGPAPARLLRSCQLGDGLRGRCAKCGGRLDRSAVVSTVEAPFAHVAVAFHATNGEGEELLRALRRASGFSWRRAR